MLTVASGETDAAKIAQAFRTIPVPGVIAGNMVVLDSSARLPAVDALNLTNSSVVSLDRNGTNQTSLTGGAFNKISFTTKTGDTNSWYDAVTNFRFLPTVSGWYLCTCSAQANSNGESPESAIYKNGTIVSGGTYVPAGMGTGIFNSNCARLIQLNGSTDYVEFFVYLPATVTTLSGTIQGTNASIAKVG